MKYTIPVIPKKNKSAPLISQSKASLTFEEPSIIAYNYLFAILIIPKDKEKLG